MKVNNLMSRNINVFLGILFFLCLSLLILFFAGSSNLNKGNFINRITTKLFDFNEIEVVYDKKETIDNIEIKFDDNIIFKGGKTFKGIDNMHGYNRFEVYQENQKVFMVSYFKKNNWHTNKYTFNFSQSTDKLDLMMEIEGIDSSCNVIYTKY